MGSRKSFAGLQMTYREYLGPDGPLAAITTKPSHSPPVSKPDHRRPGPQQAVADMAFISYRQCILQPQLYQSHNSIAHTHTCNICGFHDTKLFRQLLSVSTVILSIVPPFFSSSVEESNYKRITGCAGKVGIRCLELLVFHTRMGYFSIVKRPGHDTNIFFFFFTRVHHRGPGQDFQQVSCDAQFGSIGLFASSLIIELPVL